MTGLIAGCNLDDARTDPGCYTPAADLPGWHVPFTSAVVSVSAPTRSDAWDGGPTIGDGLLVLAVAVAIYRYRTHRRTGTAAEPGEATEP